MHISFSKHHTVTFGFKYSKFEMIISASLQMHSQKYTEDMTWEKLHFWQSRRFTLHNTDKPKFDVNLQAAKPVVHLCHVYVGISWQCGDCDCACMKTKQKSVASVLGTVQYVWQDQSAEMWFFSYQTQSSIFSSNSKTVCHLRLVEIMIIYAETGSAADCVMYSVIQHRQP